MADTMTPEERSRCMAAIKGKDTKPEMIVRKYLFSRGLRYRVQVKKLPGRPDIVLRKYKTVVFVDGCFWHGHEGCRYFRLPHTNVEFWQTKISRNKARDARNEAELTEKGWRVIRVWECEIRAVAERQEYLDELYKRIVEGFRLENQKEWISGQEEQEERMFGQEEQEYGEDMDNMDIAAEPEETYYISEYPNKST